MISSSSFSLVLYRCAHESTMAQPLQLRKRSTDIFVKDYVKQLITFTLLPQLRKSCPWSPNAWQFTCFNFTLKFNTMKPSIEKNAYSNMQTLPTKSMLCCIRKTLLSLTAQLSYHARSLSTSPVKRASFSGSYYSCACIFPSIPISDCTACLTINQAIFTLYCSL